MTRFLTLFLILTLSQQTLRPQNIFNELASDFLGKPYVAGTLEKEGGEQLIVNLQEVDCTTFVEYLTAAVLLGEKADSASPSYRDMVRRIRYRDGKIQGYTSRLHYFSEWIENNRDKQILNEVTGPANGVFIQKTIHFMSAHPQSYPALKEDPRRIDTIRHTEEKLSKHPFPFIPKENIQKQLTQIRHGDIIAITTAIPGLDISHVGFAWFDKGELYLLHASSSAGKVIIDPLPLSQYLARNKKSTGIRVLRISGKHPR